MRLRKYVSIKVLYHKIHILRKVKDGVKKDSKDKRNICRLLAVIFVSVIVAIYEIYPKYSHLGNETEKMLNPPTSKEDDLIEISQKLSEILSETKKLKDYVDAKRMTDLRTMKFGINDYELQNWELSLSGKFTEPI